MGKTVGQIRLGRGDAFQIGGVYEYNKPFLRAGGIHLQQMMLFILADHEQAPRFNQVIFIIDQECAASA